MKLITYVHARTRIVVFSAVATAALLPKTSLADSISGTGWKGTADNNWSSSGNWDNTPPNTSGTGDRNLFFGQGYIAAGGAGSTSPNNDLSSWHGYRITFQDSNAAGNGTNASSANDTAFTITGNSFTLYDWSSVFPRIENDSFLTQTINLSSGQTLGLDGNGATGQKAEINPVYGSIIIGAGTKVDLANTTQLQIFGNNGNAVTFNGQITSSGNSGNNSVVLGANSILVLAATNTYGGDTYINAGTLRCATNNAVTNNSFIRLGDTSGTSSANLNLDGGLTVSAKINVRSGNSGAMVIANTASTTGTATYGGNLFMDKDVTLFANTGGSVTLSGTTLDLKNQTLTVDGSGSSTISGVMTNSTGSGKLTKNGAGTLTITGANTNSGAISLASGKTIAAFPSAFGSGAISCAATLEISNVAIAASSLTLNNGATLSASGGTSGKYSRSSNPSVGNGATVTLSTLASSDRLEIGSGFQGGNSSSLIIVAGPGTNLLSSGSSAAGAYAGSWKLTGGTLQLSDVNALGNPSSGGTRPIELAGGILETRVTAGGTFSTATTVSANTTISPGRGSSGAGVANTFGSLSIGAVQLTVSPGVNLNNGSTAEVDFTTGTLTGDAALNVANSANVNALISISGAIAQSGGTRSLTKLGSGQLTLSGTNTYSGNTGISAGTLALGSNGSISNSAAIAIAAGAIFDVSAISTFNLSSSSTLSATGTVSAATIKGASAGTVNLGARPIVLAYDGSHPVLSISQGTLSLNGNAFTVNGSALAVGSYTLIQQASGNVTSAGTFSVTGTAIGAGKTGSISVSGGNVNLVIQNTTTTTLTRTTGSSPSLYGDSLTFHAVVSPDPGNGSTITFQTNGVAFGSATTTAGAADLTISTLPYSGSVYTVTAAFGGNANNTASSGTLSGGQQVNQHPLSITASNDTKIYGQTKTYGAGQTTFSSSGLQNSETIGSVTITANGGTAATDGTNIYSLTPSAATGGTFNANNYSITYNDGTLTVTPLAASLTGNRAYDGTTDAAFGILTVANIIGGDNVTVASGTATLAGKDVGAQAITSVGTLALGGTRATNYTLVGASGSVTINALAVDLTGTRVYDGTTDAAAAILSVANAAGGDTVNVASGVGTLASANGGSQAITSFGTLALGNNSAGNYTLTGASGSVVITQATTAIDVSSSANPSGFKDSISFTATLPADATGNVTFKTNSATFDTQTLASGAATSATTTNLPRAANTITAEYAGDINYLGSTNSITQTVTNHPPVAAPYTVTRTAGLALLVARSDMATNWNDFDGDTVTLTAVNLTTTNNIHLATNSAFILYTNSPNVTDQISYSISDNQGGTNVGYIVVVINFTVTGTNSIAQIAAGNPTALTAYGVPNYSYITERSTDLSTWTPVSTNTAAANGLISVSDDFTDLGGTPPSQAYYRIKWKP